MSVKELTHDRVWEAYYGELGHKFMRDTQKRIHWICGAVDGKRVLDIGCSSGIVPILLGREGRTVVGVDNSPKVIEQARGHLAREAEPTKQRVEFVEADFLTVNPSDYPPFDTIVISEVLEHLLKPQDMLEIAARFLCPNGKIVVTVPFGINDFIDHKQTFYLTAIHDLLSRSFDICAVEYLDKWIGLVATKPEDGICKGPRVLIPSEEVNLLEQSFFRIERGLRDDTVAKNENLKLLENELKSLSQTNTLISEQKHELEANLLNKEEFEHHLNSERQKLEIELAQLRHFNEELVASVDAKEQEIAHINAALIKAETNFKGLLGRESSYKDTIDQLKGDIRKSQQALTRMEQQRTCAETRATNIKNSLTYQLGSALIQATSSWQGLIRFPKSALRIHREGKRRDAAKRSEQQIIAKKKETIAFSSVTSTPATLPATLKADNSRRLRVAGIMDEFTFHSYEPECVLLQLTPEKWQDQLAEFKPDILFIESAWKGIDGLWQGKVSNAASELLDLVAWCRDAKVPSIFWNKEDPVHFSTFTPVAKSVDYVFTTDIDCIPKYKHEVGHDRVYLLPFAAQPSIHNPIELYDRKDAFNFAGSYYLRYPERQRDFGALIEAVAAVRPVEIFDRNFDNPHPHYAFPEQYRSLILGKLPFAEIDRAYKGYKYGINMNTIKQSQTMFARRVFELLASNTVVVSNFSRGVRLLFGDLVISSDDTTRLRDRLNTICCSDSAYRKFRLLGLRKVMSEHTYGHRLRYILSKLSPSGDERQSTPIILVGVAESERELAQLVENFQRQRYNSKRLFVVRSGQFGHPLEADGVEEFETIADCADAIQKIDGGNLLGLLNPDDYYGPEYLTDLQLARTYSSALAFGKAARYEAVNGDLKLRGDGKQYRATDSLVARSALVVASAVSSDWIKAALANLSDAMLPNCDMLATDEFHYVEGGMHLPDSVRSLVNDAAVPDVGASLAVQILPMAEGLGRANSLGTGTPTELPHFSAEQLAELLPTSGSVRLTLGDGKLKIRANGGADKRVYLYAKKEFSRQELNLVLNSQFELVCEGGLDLKTVFEFKDENGVKISHQMNAAGGRHSLAIPENCTTIRFGLRVQGPGVADIFTLVLGSQVERPAAIVLRSPYLVLSKQYPAYDDLYRYGFLHSRLRAYKEADLIADVFRITKEAPGYREFEGIDVASGDAELLQATLATGQVKHLMIHLLDEHMWRVVRRHLHNVQVTVWVHGAEIQVWQRRAFEFERMSDKEIARQKRLSEGRKALWQEVFSDASQNLRFVFVSRYFLNEIQEDMGVNLDSSRYFIVHNFIDGNIFKFSEKEEHHRKKILSIRPYANRKYANDLTVAALLELSRREIFAELEFCLYGDGELFDEVTAPLQGFDNVKLRRQFLSQSEIAQVHSEFGVFLTPTRMDAQGVSRDEAMSSGLVPITTDVACIPEFVDKSCGVVVPAEDHVALADAIERLLLDPDEFLALSKAASRRVMSQSGYEMTIRREIEIIEGC